MAQGTNTLSRLGETGHVQAEEQVHREGGRTAKYPVEK
jgi:hypothetical protein